MIDPYIHMDHIPEYNDEEYVDGLKYEFFTELWLSGHIKVYPEEGIVYNPITNKIYNSTNNKGYIDIVYRHPNGYQVHFAAHKLVWWSVNGPYPKGYSIYHWNGNASDNRISNLYIKTKKQKEYASKHYTVNSNPKHMRKDYSYPQDPNILNTIRKEISKGDYKYALVPEHPNATKNGYVLMHRAVMENYLGRYLEPWEEVHHIDENRHNNCIENLELTISGEHQRYHMNNVGKTYIKMKCPMCDKIFVRPKGSSYHTIHNKYNCNFCSRECGYNFNRYISKYGLTPEIQQKIDECFIESFVHHGEFIDNNF